MQLLLEFFLLAMILKSLFHHILDLLFAVLPIPISVITAQGKVTFASFSP